MTWIHDNNFGQYYSENLAVYEYTGWPSFKPVLWKAGSCDTRINTLRLAEWAPQSDSSLRKEVAHGPALATTHSCTSDNHGEIRSTTIYAESNAFIIIWIISFPPRSGHRQLRLWSWRTAYSITNLNSYTQLCLDGLNFVDCHRLAVCFEPGIHTKLQACLVHGTDYFNVAFPALRPHRLICWPAIETVKWRLWATNSSKRPSRSAKATS